MKKRTAYLLAAGAGAWLAWRAYRTYFGYDLRDKVVLITGGSRGLGLVLAREAARQGAHVAICARDAGELARARDDLHGYGTHVFAIPCDLTDRGQAQDMVATVERHFGRLDVLINNAGVIQVDPVETMNLADYEEAMAIHYWAPLYTTLAPLPGMRRRRSGRIVNISSIGGKLAVPHLVPYEASKFALVGLSEGLRAELMKDGIVVTTVCPGLMRTGSPRNAFFKAQHRAEYVWFTLGGALPIMSTSAESAARWILAGCRRGDAEVILTLPSKAAAAFHGLFPGLTADILGMVNRLLPGPGGIGTARARGKDSQSALAPSPLTALNERAAARNNELEPGAVS
jgi:NAD(P)-dependent dehydrogenase (short-subunit alcohol dehydrogenase family)